jgi:UDP:flavonoid glycosyltransferase YjiC (YdhE family)
MRPLKFLLIPGNNSLSHIAKCLAIEKALAVRGHETLIAVSRKSSQFLRRLGVDHAVLPDIQEKDDAGLPTVEWFRDPQSIADCVDAEVDLLKRYKPDRALGVFRFTLKASAQAAGVPFDSLICGCMLPGSPAVLGFNGDEPGFRSQQIILDGFYRYAGAKASSAFKPYGVGTIADIRSLLAGERTFLWDFPEFSPLPARPDTIHVGPITCNQWPYDPLDINAIRNNGSPLAVIAFGTCAGHGAVAKRIMNILVGLGYHVLLAAGGQKALMDIVPHNGHVTVCSFAPLHEIFPHASLLVSHGGQMTVFEALQHEVPVLVMPFQPEQAHNGVCLERIGCGSRLIPAQCFQGDPRVYVEAINGRGDDEIACVITELVQNPETPKRLTAMRKIMERYRGVENLAARLEAV